MLIESVTLDRDVLVARQGQVTHPAAEVLHVPESPLGRRVLRGEDELVTGLAPRDVHLAGEVSTTVQMSLGENSVFFISSEPKYQDMVIAGYHHPPTTTITPY